MKHLLILLSFLLLSSFVTSCDKKEETLYRWETSSGIVWKTFGNEKLQPKYEGEWKDGKPWNGILSDKKGNILYKIVNGI